MPTCGNCHRRNEACEYETWKQVDPASVIARQAKPKRNDVTITTIPPQPHITNIPMNLLFAVNSPWRKSIRCNDQRAQEESQLWAGLLSNNVAKHQYLQYCLSSITYLYNQTHELHPQQEERTHAYQHQIAASALFRRSPSSIDESNWVGVLIFSISLLVFQFASQQVSSSLIDYMETLRVLKMSASVTHFVGPFLARSEAWTFIQKRNGLRWQPVDPTIWVALRNLKDTIAVSVTNNSDVLFAAVESLEQWAKLCNGSPLSWREYALFPGMVSTEFLQCLAEDDDAALLILIYWCAIMHRGPKRWFFERWLTRTATIARAKLTRDWADALLWPDTLLQGYGTAIVGG
jgi:hypothetical protein